MESKRMLAMLLVGGLGASGLAAAPGAAHAARTPAAGIRVAAPAATPTPQKKHVMLAATPTTTNRGGVVTVSGSGFAPNELVNLTINGVKGVAATAKANAQGLLPATGVTVPYSLKPGAVTITAAGATSKRNGTLKVTIAALTPSISLSAGTLSPGQTATVIGKGFGNKEQITLSLNGEALVTSPQAITTTNGSFTASFKVPNALLRGANTISAIGNESRVSTVAHLIGKLPRSTQFYFAGGLNTAQDHSYIGLLNTNDQPASVRLTFFFDNGAQYTRLVTVGAHAQKRVKVANLNFLPEGRYGLQVRADRQISAEITTDRGMNDWDNLLGESSLDTHWYLAGGSTSGTFQERVSILNTDAATPAHVQLQMLGSNGVLKTATVSVPAHTNKVVNVNNLLPGKDFGIMATSDRPVLVERTLNFGQDGRGYTTLIASNKPATNWLFSDGTTENNVHTVLTMLNPNATTAQVTVSFSQGHGVTLGSHTVTVAANSRATLPINSVVQGGGIAIVVTSNQPIVTERAEYIGMPDTATAGSVVVGRNGAATQWTFLGGDTTPGKDEVLDLYNPSAVTVPITATFYGSGGKVETRTYSLAPTQRLIIPVNTLGLSDTHGAVLKSGNVQGFIAEAGISTKDSHSLRHTQGFAQ
jgi:hypothetical protein